MNTLVTAAERGRTGESYLLGAHNVKPKQLAQLAMAELGISRPILELPIGLLDMPARGLELLSRRVTRRPPLFTPAALRIAKLGLTARCDKAVRELGLAQRPVLESVRDALAWFAANGYIREAKARAKQTIRRGTAPRDRGSAGANASTPRLSEISTSSLWTSSAPASTQVWINKP